MSCGTNSRAPVLLDIADSIHGKARLLNSYLVAEYRSCLKDISRIFSPFVSCLGDDIYAADFEVYGDYDDVTMTIEFL